MTTRNTLLASLALALATGVQADTLTAPNAAFNWTDTNAWSGGTATWNSATPDDAVFGDISTNRTVTLTSAVTAGDISFSNAANTWTVSGAGGEIVLNGALTKTNAGTAILSNNTVLSGAGSVSVSGGELQLLGANTFSGGVTLNSGGTLRMGVSNGTGTPQTVGHLGTGTFTINGGTFYHTQGNVRNQAVDTLINGNFTAHFVAGGGTRLGTTTGDRTVSLGTGVRTITVGNNSSGVGANAFLTLNSLTNGVGGSIIKEGDGWLRINGSGFSNGNATVNDGTLDVDGALGVTNFTMNSGTVWRISTATNLTSASTMTLNNASLVNNDTLANQRRSHFETLQVSGTSTVFLGQGLNVRSDTLNANGFNVLAGGVLGGNGILRTAGTQSITAGVTSFDSITDSAITLGVGGSIRPGTVDALNSTIGTLSFGDLTWNGEASSVAQMAFNLGAANASDRIALSGALTKGTGDFFVFDFNAFSATETGLFTLATFGSTTFSASDFSASNVTYDSGLSGSFVVNSDSLQFAVIPEPGTIAMMGLFGLSVLLVLRRRK